MWVQIIFLKKLYAFEPPKALMLHIITTLWGKKSCKQTRHHDVEIIWLQRKREKNVQMNWTYACNLIIFNCCIQFDREMEKTATANIRTNDIQNAFIKRAISIFSVFVCKMLIAFGRDKRPDDIIELDFRKRGHGCEVHVTCSCDWVSERESFAIATHCSNVLYNT